MGFSKLLDEVVDRMTEVSPLAWRLYCYLLRCHNRDRGQCNPSAVKCATAIGVTPKHIFKLRRELSEAGWVAFDYGNATFLIGAKGIPLDTLEDLDGIQPDTVEDLDGIPLDTPRYPAGYPPVSPRILGGIPTDTAYKEEPEELTRGMEPERALTRHAQENNLPFLEVLPPTQAINLWRKESVRPERLRAVCPLTIRLFHSFVNWRNSIRQRNSGR